MRWVVVVAAAVLAMAWVPGGDATPWPALALWGVAFLAYGLAARDVTSLSSRAVWGGAIATRLGLVGAAPSLSEDIYRYVWDGWILRNGINPFSYAPASEELAAFRTEWWDVINHPTIPTIYPPGAQLLFGFLAWIVPSWVLFKVAWLVADLAVAWLIGRLSRAAERDARLPVFLYLWSPLVLVEVAWSGHFEPVGIALMLGAALAVGGRAWLGGALLGLGGAVKFAPLAALPALARRHGIVAVGTAVAVVTLLYLPFSGVGVRLFEALRTYADIWEFNAGLFAALDRLPGPTDLGRWIGGLAVLAAALIAAARRVALVDALYWTITTGLLVSPTIHPWYVLWVLPFACLSGNRAWLLLSGTVFLSYAGRDIYLATGQWPEPLWLRLLIHGPFFALLLRDWRNAERRKGGQAGTQGLDGGGRVAEREQTGEG